MSESRAKESEPKLPKDGTTQPIRSVNDEEHEKKLLEELKRVRRSMI